jgi:hypothetical protein
MISIIWLSRPPFPAACVIGDYNKTVLFFFISLIPGMDSILEGFIRLEY